MRELLDTPFLRNRAIWSLRARIIAKFQDRERKEAEGKQLEVKRYSDDVMQKNAWLS